MSFMFLRFSISASVQVAMLYTCRQGVCAADGALRVRGRWPILIENAWLRDDATKHCADNKGLHSILGIVRCAWRYELLNCLGATLSSAPVQVESGAVPVGFAVPPTLASFCSS